MKSHRTITVGQKDAAIMGQDQQALQLALDSLAADGGGTLKVGPGRYTFRNALHLRDNIRIIGAGEETVFVKCASRESAVVADSDWWDSAVEIADATGFEIGDGIVLRGKEPHNQKNLCLRYTILGKTDNRLQLNDSFNHSIWHEGSFNVASLFPMLCGERVENIEIQDLVIDGNGAENDNLNGNYGGGIFIERGRNVTVRNVTIKDYNGDGFSWQIVDDVTVQKCQFLDNTGLGLHPGSGSKRPLIEDNTVRGGHIGLFFCWGVTHGTARRNNIDGSKIGVSIGYRDTDNVVCDNNITNAKDVGILFRNEQEPARSPNRNRIAQNRVEDCGPVDEGCAIRLTGPVSEIEITGNALSEKRPEATASIGIEVGPEVSELTLADNELTGFSTDVKRESET